MARTAPGAAKAGPVDKFAVEQVAIIETELRRLLARARAVSSQTAAAVHPQLDPALYAGLMEIVRSAPVRSVELAHARGVSKSVISRQVAALENLGLIAREPDPTDARASVLVLTKRGREAARTIDQARRMHLKRLFEALTPEELAQIAQSLGRLNDILE